MNDPHADAAAGVPSGWCCWPPAGTFALTMGVRQSMGLFVSSLNTATGLGHGAASASRSRSASSGGA